MPKQICNQGACGICTNTPSTVVCWACLDYGHVLSCTCEKRPVYFAKSEHRRLNDEDGRGDMVCASCEEKRAAYQQACDEAGKKHEEKKAIEKSIERYLVISTGNLPKNEWLQLAWKGANGGPLSRSHEDGYYVRVEPLEQHLHDMPALASLFLLAREHGCTWINFDRDAEPLHGAPVWEW